MDVSVAVAIPVRLVTPIVRNADGMGISAIFRAGKDLVKRASSSQKSKLEINADRYLAEKSKIANDGS